MKRKHPSGLSGGSAQRAMQGAPLHEQQGVVAKAIVAVSSLATYLITKFVWGDKTGIDVRESAKFAVEDGASHPDLRRLAAVREDHAHGDILNFLRPSPTWIACLV